MSKPFFSVILPTHNGEKRIRKAIESVLAQTFDNYELIVVCDSCTDDTHNRVQWFPYDCIRIIDTDVHRDGLARNVGLDAAQGEWILFLDDDDWFLHEYCFEQLAKIAKHTTADVIDFSFIWKGEGYKIPSPDETFVMAWCRAWRKSFIGSNRFDDAPYGSDLHFYQRMIQDNMDISITFWNMPLYYYNYMREGSLSWMEKKHYYLDIIVTHHDEPWEICKPFFDMMENQRCFDKDKVHITFVQDGDNERIDFVPFLPEYYNLNVKYLTLDKPSGTAAARNYAIRESEADWLMFVNCDDMFADVCSLSMFMENFPTDECDVIWSKLARECKWYTGTIYINKTDGVNFSNTDGKMYRRQFLLDNNITFPEDPVAKYWYDHVFNSIVLTCTKPFRIAMLTTDFYPYYKTFRADSLRHTEEAFKALYGSSILNRERIISSILLDKGYEYESKRAIMKAVCREYYAVYNPNEQDKKLRLTTDFLDFYNEHEEDILSISQEDLDPIKAEAETEVLNLIQSYYNEHKQELYLVNDSLSFSQWIQIVQKYASTRKTGTKLPQSEPDPEPQDNIVPLPTATTPDISTKQDPRIVVYCGTYDVYLNMVASCKSLLCNTPVDKVYFLIEDDVFPYDLPDIVTTINVKDQQYFPSDGPNFNNSWTYMCMIRAAFPELFPQYSKILSLDIDVVIRDNVSDLWDYDLSDYYLAGVPERQRQKSSADPLYINFGVVMMNLDKLRNDNIQEPLINALNTRKFGCPEQDAYNKFCANHILDLPADYNFTAYSHITGDAQKKRIIHYAGQKFWRHYDIVKEYSDLEWNEVMRKQNELKEGDING